MLKDDILLQVKSLNITYYKKIYNKLIYNEVVKGVSFSLSKGDKLALLGSSGSGKSSIALALLGLLPRNAICTGEILYMGKRLEKLKDFLRIRGSHMSIVFQQPHSYLNPVLSIEKQLVDLLRVKRNLVKKKEIDKEINQVLSQVALPSIVRRRFPFQLSGGMAQRVLIAQTLLLKPNVIIADEITTSLDMPMRRDILDLLLELQSKYSFALLFVTHDIRAVKYIKAQTLCLQ